MISMPCFPLVPESMLYRLVRLAPWMILAVSPVSGAEPATCSYSTYQWNVIEKRAVNRERVVHAYSRLTDREVDRLTGCTVCEEDQVTIRLPGLEAFRLCHVLADEVRQILQRQLEQGRPIYHITGYRVGMTKGEADADGNRTRFSYHSYGIALDINARHNGLYENCIRFGPDCQLRRGGHWDPQQPASLTRHHPLVKAFKRFGLKWGGEISGQQKDFMHFSPYGY